MEPYRYRIIIVEDNAPFRRIVRNYIHIHAPQYVVKEATNGYDLLDLLTNESFDIILMDINMSGLNGVETTKIVNQKYFRSTRIIALSQNDEFEYMRSMLEAGAKGYVVKQELCAHLLKAIETVIKGKTYFSGLVQ